MLLFEDVAWTAAFIAGVLSFFSPCILPLVPSYFSFITGISIDHLTQSPTGIVRRRIITSTLAFVAGFSLVFILLGATAAFFSSMIQEIRGPIRIIGGLLIIVLGLHLMGVWRIGWLETDRRIQLNQKPVHALGALIIGMAFAAGWSPCIGPLLGSVLILAANQDTVIRGIGLLTLYSTGLAIPFILLSVGIHYLIRFVRRAAKAIRVINLVAGGLLVVTGLLLIADRLGVLGFY